MSPDRLQRAADHTEDANKVSGRRTAASTSQSREWRPLKSILAKYL